MTYDLMAKSVSVAEAKSQFADMLAKVKHTGERVIIERRGRPIAALVPLADLDRLEEGRSVGLLGLVGALPDSEAYARAIDETVSERKRERTRRVPRPRS